MDSEGGAKAHAREVGSDARECAKWCTYVYSYTRREDEDQGQRWGKEIKEEKGKRRRKIAGALSKFGSATPTRIKGVGTCFSFFFFLPQVDENDDRVG
jgi:hypothetical protein